MKEMERGKWDFFIITPFWRRTYWPSNYKAWKPIIVATQGHVNGAGLWSVCESDIIISSDNALFGTREVRANVPVLVAPFLSDYIPHSIAADIIFSAKPITAQRA